MGLTTRVIRVSPAGDPGAAIGSTTIGVPPSKLQAIQIHYADQPDTTNIAITHVLAGVEKTIMILSDRNDDLSLHGAAESIVDDAGEEIQVVIPPRLNGRIRVDVTNGDEIENGVVITLELEV
jgi:hypothetical protein